MSATDLNAAKGHVMAAVGAKDSRYRFLLAMAAGAIAVLALPPFDLAFLLVPTLGFLFLQIGAARSPWHAFAAGWGFGFGYFVAGLHWIGISFAHSPGHLHLLAVPAVLCLSAFLALFPGGAAAVHSLVRRNSEASALLFAAAWTGFEWLRGHVLTGFPWNLIGYAWTDYDAPRQAASAIGVYGLSFITILLTSLIAAGLTAGGPTRAVRLVVAILIGAAIWAGGMARLILNDAPPGSGPAVRVVQANIEQSIKWRGAVDALENYLEMSRKADLTPGSVLVWPETAMPFFLADDALALAHLAGAIPSHGYLLTGALRKGGGPRDYRNSLLMISDRGRVAGFFDKHRLVPFGEYMPLGSTFPAVELFAGPSAFTAGTTRRLAQLPGLAAFVPLICYEAIFPGEVPSSPVRPSWLVNITNDAWFGRSAGPYQHLAAAQMRAVEEGMPMVRAANTGISAIIDPYGRILVDLDVGLKGTIDATLPRALPGTIYSRYGDWLLFMGLALGGYLGVRQRPRNNLVDGATPRN